MKQWMQLRQFISKLIKSKLVCITQLASLPLLIIFTNNALANADSLELLAKSSSISVHHKGSQGLLFSESLKIAEKKSQPITNKVLTRSEHQSLINSSPLNVQQKIKYELSPESWKEQYLELPSLAKCDRPAIRALPISTALSQESKAINFLYYDAYEATQVGKANALDPNQAVAYYAGPYIEDSDLKSTKQLSDPRLLLSYLSGIRCLPTRMHFVERDGMGLLELREGSAAW